MKGWRGLFLRNQEGQSMVEFALILPVLLLLVFGIIEFGRVFSAQIIINHAARDGARYAVVGNSDDDIEAVMVSSLLYLDEDLAVFIIDPGEGSRDRGEAVTVHIDYPIEIYTPIISNIIGSPLQLSSEVEMRME